MAREERSVIPFEEDVEADERGDDRENHRCDQVELQHTAEDWAFVFSHRFRSVVRDDDYGFRERNHILPESIAYCGSRRLQRA